MIKRIATTGVNLVVRGVSVAIFLMVFIALNALGAVQNRLQSQSYLPPASQRWRHLNR